MENNNPDPPGSLSTLPKADFIQIYESTLRCIDREDNLIYYRLTWALQINVALIALLFLVDKVQPPLKPSYLVAVISVSGMVFTFISLLAIRAARKQLECLRTHLDFAANHVDKRQFFRKHVAKASGPIDERTGFPRPYGVQEGSRALGDHASTVYCVSLIIGWVLILGSQLNR